MLSISRNGKWIPAFASLIFAFAFCSCQDRNSKGQILDTPTNGTITIAADESLRPVVDANISAFEGIYRYAKIVVNYTSEKEAIRLLQADSVRLCILTRSLTQAELTPLEEQHIVPQALTVAYDAIAVIGPRTMKDTVLSMDQLNGILSGHISHWNQIDTGGERDSIAVIFDQPHSAITRYLQDSLGIPTLSSHCYAVHGNREVLEAVSTSRTTLGLIGVGWISDSDDSTSNAFTNSVKVLSIKSDSSEYQPYQAYIAQHHYPLTRPIVITSREARAGLGSGLTAFIAGDKGQRIFLKSGLVPATMPLRIVEINHEPL